MLYHLVTKPIPPDAVGDYRPDSLETEGFIHLAYGHQVAWVANQFFATAPFLWVAEIDPDLLASDVRDEDPGVGEKFPHLYAPLPFEAIRRLIPMTKSESGGWDFRPQI